MSTASNIVFGPAKASERANIQAGQRTVAQVLGEIVWLLTQSPVHKTLFISDLEWAIMPALLFEQFRIFYNNGQPAGLVLWASVSEQTELRLESGGPIRLRPDEWKSGDRLWLVEMVAPFGGQEEMLADCATVVFGGKPFKYQKTSTSGSEIAIHEAKPQ
ncbi:toxin-activating lysine-acyltransferase [Sandaracinobacter sp. RS1-74]|uniref:toxin-activating lysine-acyltransferase n=1 Tax=Sandaracinobacteroides sayramensis TaxID=2913411 RepID=UPI001EDAD8C2|nr:toxin-activating lysine-acyltransferase [Sandaracinobacteroides sayramensis]MCG2842127.1 toxin-activating lysine-acyltransferase [Sandaracinobacteroides sayramensis]